jgi:hypothetical protein
MTGNVAAASVALGGLAGARAGRRKRHDNDTFYNASNSPNWMFHNANANPDWKRVPELERAVKAMRAQLKKAKTDARKHSNMKTKLAAANRDLALAKKGLEKCGDMRALVNNLRRSLDAAEARAERAGVQAKECQLKLKEAEAREERDQKLIQDIAYNTRRIKAWLHQKK